MTARNVTDHDRLTICKLLLGGRSVEFVSAATTINLRTVHELATGMGWPDQAATRRHLLELNDKIAADRAPTRLPADRERAAIPTLHARPSAAPSTTRPAPPTQATAADPPSPRLRVLPNPEPATPPPPDAPAAACHHEALLARGAQSGKAATRRLTERIDGLLVQLADQLRAQQVAAREAEEKLQIRLQAEAELAKLEKRLAEAQEKVHAARGVVAETKAAAPRTAEQQAATAANRQNALRRQQERLDQLGVTAAEVRAWAKTSGHNQGGALLARATLDAYERAHR